METPQDCKSIEEVRQKIDEIDIEIIGLIGKRFDYVQEVVKYKNSTDEVYAKQRYDAVIIKRREIAKSHHLNPDIIEKIYRLMMDYFIEVQLELIRKK